MYLTSIENHLQGLQALVWTLNHLCHHQLKRSIWTKKIKICRISFYRIKRLWEHLTGTSVVTSFLSGKWQTQGLLFCVWQSLQKPLFQGKSKHRNLKAWHQPHSSRYKKIHAFTPMVSFADSKEFGKGGGQGTASMIAQDTACQQGWD